jgi:hypothetical protein
MFKTFMIMSDGAMRDFFLFLLPFSSIVFESLRYVNHIYNLFVRRPFVSLDQLVVLKRNWTGVYIYTPFLYKSLLLWQSVFHLHKVSVWITE